MTSGAGSSSAPKSRPLPDHVFKLRLLQTLWLTLTLLCYLSPWQQGVYSPTQDVRRCHLFLMFSKLAQSHWITLVPTLLIWNMFFGFVYRGFLSTLKYIRYKSHPVNSNSKEKTTISQNTFRARLGMWNRMFFCKQWITQIITTMITTTTMMITEEVFVWNPPEPTQCSSLPGLSRPSAQRRSARYSPGVQIISSPPWIDVSQCQSLGTISKSRHNFKV